MRSCVLQLRDGGRGGLGRSDQSYQGSNTIGPPAVYPQRIRTLSTPPTRRMCRPTSRSCLKFMSEDLKTVEVSVVALTTSDSKRPRVHERYEQSFQKHGARALNKSTSKKPSLATLSNNSARNKNSGSPVAQKVSC
jgi:hypothetical protein